MQRASRTELVVEGIKRYGLEFTGLSETLLLGSGKARMDGLTFVDAAKRDGTYERGVAIALGHRAEKMLETYEYVNEWIVWCKLNGRYSNGTMVQVYAKRRIKQMKKTTSSMQIRRTCKVCDTTRNFALNGRFKRQGRAG